MKMKRWALLSLCAALTIAVAGFATSAFAAYRTDWEDCKSGASVVVNGETWSVGGYVKDYLRGTDEEGNFTIQNKSGEASFKGGSDKRMILDGLRMKFRIETEDGTLAPGAHFVLGLSKRTGEDSYPTVGFAFVMQESGKFEMYVVSDHHILAGDGIWQNGASAGKHDVLSLMRDSSGRETTEEIRVGDEVCIEVAYLTPAQCAAWGLQHPTYARYVLFVNGKAHYYLSNTQNGFYCINGDLSRGLSKDEAGKLYGYMTVFGNAAGEVLGCIPSPAEVAALEGNKEVRLTFTDLIGDGTGSVDWKPATTAREGFLAAGETDYRYGTVPAGPYAGATLVEAGEKNIAYRTTNAADLKGFEYNALFRDLARFDDADPKSATLTFASSAESGASRFDVVLTRTAEDVLTVTSSIGEGTIAVDQLNFRNSVEVSIGVYTDTAGQLTVCANGLPVARGTLDAAFAENMGYMTLETNFDRVIETGMVSDGTAQRKLVIVDIDAQFPNPELARGSELEDLPETCEVTLDDGSKVQVTLTWDTTPYRKDTPGQYTISGSLTEDALRQYLIGRDVASRICFLATVHMPEGYTEFQSSDYKAAQYTWEPVSNLNNNVYYKKADGVDYFISNGFSSNTQFMPMDSVKKDVNGFSLDLTARDHGTTPYFIVGLMPNMAHINGERPHLSLLFEKLGEDKSKVMIFSNPTFSNGVAEFAKLVNKADETSVVDGAGGIPFDWTGNQSVSISFRTEADQKVHMDLTVGETVYEVRYADGVTAKTVDASVYANGKGYVLLWNETGYNEFTLRQHYTRYAVGFERPENEKIVSFGEPHGLPTTAVLRLNDGSTAEGKIVWSGEYDATTAGTYRLTGTVGYEGALSIGNGETIWEDVESDTVTVDVIVREEVRTVKSIALPQDFSVAYGTVPSWDAQVEIQVYSAYTEQTTTEIVGVNFVCATFNRFVAGEYTFTANLVGSYTMDAGVVATVKVTVLPEEGGEEPVDPPKGGGGCGKKDAASATTVVLLLGIAFVGKKILK